MSENCEHVFRRLWCCSRYWRCVKCEFVTRRYSAADRAMMRPIHPRMSVALPGFNTTRRSR